jgi:DNA polymerase III subunit epsilon
MRWAAFDFETATHARDSGCALGVVVVDDGDVVARQAWLMRPPGNRYHPRNVAVHGIRPIDTEHAPEFAEVWAEVEYLVGDRPLVAHNAAFDLGVLAASAASTGALVRAREVWCTLRLSRRTWPELGRWNLPSVAAKVGAELQHHDALSDAAACSSVLAACIREHGAPGLGALHELTGVDPRRCGAEHPLPGAALSSPGAPGPAPALAPA